jgi:predicted ArsR family transcriptional regulator
MNLGPKPRTGDKVLELLRDIGPMSAREIADFLGVRIQNIHSAITVMRDNEAKGEPRRLYVKDWEFPSRPNGGRENAVWALGTKKDKRRPARDRSVAGRRYRDKQAAIDQAKRIGTQAAGNPFGLVIAQLAGAARETAARAF